MKKSVILFMALSIALIILFFSIEETHYNKYITIENIKKESVVIVPDEYEFATSALDQNSSQVTGAYYFDTYPAFEIFETGPEITLAPTNEPSSTTTTPAVPEKRKQTENPPKDVKTLEALHGTLTSHTKGDEAIQAYISGNQLTIDVYINFTGAHSTDFNGKTFTYLAKQGLLLWEGQYQGNQHDFEPGMEFNVTISIHDIYNGKNAEAGQNYFDFHIKDSRGVAFVNYNVGYYHREHLGTDYVNAYPQYKYGTVVMYNGIGGAYSHNQYIKTAAHEFGHVLGLGDQYGKGLKSTTEVPNGPKYVSGDMMGAHGHVTSNNIEMFLSAYKTNQYQAYVTSGNEVRSDVIRSY